MAKNTHAQEIATGTPDSYTETELQNLPRVVITRPILGEVDRAVITEAYTAKDVKGEESSATVDGGDSTQSSESESTENDRQNPSHHQPAPTTDSHSPQIEPVTSDANLTAGSGHGTEPQRSAKGRQTPTTKKAAPKKQTGARATMMDAEDDFDEFD